MLVFIDIIDILDMECDLVVVCDWCDLVVKVVGIGVWEYFVDMGCCVLDEVEQVLLNSSEEEYIDDLLEWVIVEEDWNEVWCLLKLFGESGVDFEVNFRVYIVDGMVCWVKGFGCVVFKSDLGWIVGVLVDIMVEYVVVEICDLMVCEMNYWVINLFVIIGSMIIGVLWIQIDVCVFVLFMCECIIVFGCMYLLVIVDCCDEVIDLFEIICIMIVFYNDYVMILIDGFVVWVLLLNLLFLLMMLYEWVMNVVKYGVFCNVMGWLDIIWEKIFLGVEFIWWEIFEQIGIMKGLLGFGMCLVEMLVQQIGVWFEQLIIGDWVEWIFIILGDVFVDE